MAGPGNEYEIGNCPKSKRHLRGGNIGQIIQITKFNNGQIGCAEIGRCKDLCPAIFHKSKEDTSAREVCTGHY